MGLTKSEGAKSIDLCKPVEAYVRESGNKICITLECALISSKSRMIFQSVKEVRLNIALTETEEPNPKITFTGVPSTLV